VWSEVTGRTSIEFEILAETNELSMWILMPEGKAYDSWLITRTVTEKHGKVEVVTPVQEFLSGDSTIIGFQLVSARPGERYEISWTYK
jgi:hypothetical protein